MDNETNKTSNVKAKINQHKNEKKEKMETDTDENLDEVCHQMSHLAEEENASSGSPSSSDSEDIVNAINYNTITSLAALKDIIQGDGNDTPETDSFFQHYFMNHCNNLSSRNSSLAPPFFPERRRLSQCREEDEDDDNKESDPSWSAASETGYAVASLGSPTAFGKGCDVDESNVNVIVDVKATELCESSQSKEQDTQKRTVMGAKHKFLVTTTEPPVPPPPLVLRALRTHVHNAHTVHFGTKGAEEQRPSARSVFEGGNLHKDKKYFDSSLIEIRSIVDGIQTSSEDIWVKRTEDKPVSMLWYIVAHSSGNIM